MLRKNFIQKKKDINNCISMETQTDEFMLYLTVQEKLKAIMTQYRNIEKEYYEAINKIQYLQYKNNLLESSLLETTYVFNNNLLGQNIKHIKELAELQELIQVQNCQLVKMHQKTTSRLIEETQGQTHQNKQAISKDSKEISKNSSSKISSFSKPKQKGQNSKKNLPVELQRRFHEQGQSQNQFLFQKSEYSKASHLFDMTLQQKKIQQFDSEMNKMLSQTARTNRLQPKYNSFKKKKNSVDSKENDCLVKMMKLEAELKLKNFMSQFQKNSTLSISKSKEISPKEQKTFIQSLQQTYGSEILEKQSSPSYSLIMKKSMR